jgi:acetyl esterase/lipase
VIGEKRTYSDENGGLSVYAAPSCEIDLRFLPEAFIDVGAAEVFRDEAVDYASRLWELGGQAELHVFLPYN